MIVKCPQCGESREERFIPNMFCDSCGWHFSQPEEIKDMIFKDIRRVEKEDGLGPPTNVLHLLKEIWLMLKEIFDYLVSKK